MPFKVIAPKTNQLTCHSFTEDRYKCVHCANETCVCVVCNVVPVSLVSPDSAANDSHFRMERLAMMRTIQYNTITFVAASVRRGALCQWWWPTHLGHTLPVCCAQVDRERRDPRGRTPLMLAVSLGRTAATRLLLQHNCNVNADNADGWNGRP